MDRVVGYGWGCWIWIGLRDMDRVEGRWKGCGIWIALRDMTRVESVGHRALGARGPKGRHPASRSTVYEVVCQVDGCHLQALPAHDTSRAGPRFKTARFLMTVPMPRVPGGYEGVGFSYERGTPVGPARRQPGFGLRPAITLHTTPYTLYSTP